MSNMHDLLTCVLPSCTDNLFIFISLTHRQPRPNATDNLNDHERTPTTPHYIPPPSGAGILLLRYCNPTATRVRLGVSNQGALFLPTPTTTALKEYPPLTDPWGGTDNLFITTPSPTGGVPSRHLQPLQHHPLSPGGAKTVFLNTTNP